MEVARSCSKTIQVQQYEPMSFFSSYKAVVEGNPTKEELNKISEELYERAEEEAMDNAEKYQNPGKAVTKKLTNRQLLNAIKKANQEIAQLKIKVANLDKAF